MSAPLICCAFLLLPPGAKHPQLLQFCLLCIPQKHQCSLLCCMLQCLPIGVLQCIYAQRAETSGMMETLSYVPLWHHPRICVPISAFNISCCRLATTFGMFGMKLAKVSDILTLRQYLHKQMIKVDRLAPTAPEDTRGRILDTEDVVRNRPISIELSSRNTPVFGVC